MCRIQNLMNSNGYNDYHLYFIAMMFIRAIRVRDRVDTAPVTCCVGQISNICLIVSTAFYFFLNNMYTKMFLDVFVLNSIE